MWVTFACREVIKKIEQQQLQSRNKILNRIVFRLEGKRNKGGGVGVYFYKTATPSIKVKIKIYNIFPNSIVLDIRQE